MMWYYVVFSAAFCVLFQLMMTTTHTPISSSPFCGLPVSALLPPLSTHPYPTWCGSCPPLFWFPLLPFPLLSFAFHAGGRAQADRFRLHIPLHVSEEGPEYVSTGDLLPPPSTPAPPRVEQEQEPLESNGKVTARVMEAEEEEEGEIEDGEIEDGEVNAAKDGEVGLLGGGKVEGGESEVAGIIAAAAKVCLKHSDAMEGEEEGEIAATPAARPRASAADEEGKNVPAGAEAGAEVGALPSTLDEGKEKSAPAPAPAVDAQSGGAEDGEILPTNVAANSAGQAGEEKGEVLLTNASTGGSEPGEEGEVSQPGAASGELSHGSEDFPGGKEEAGLGGGARGGGGASVGGGVVDAGREPRATFVVPSTEALCPIPSGPRKGAVILGFDCEMVRIDEALSLFLCAFWWYFFPMWIMFCFFVVVGYRWVAYISSTCMVCDTPSNPAKIFAMQRDCRWKA